MERISASLAMVGALAIVLTEAAPAKAQITNPDWAKRPSAEDLHEHYPEIARQLMLPGHTILSCSVAANGGLGDCYVSSEGPKGLGFGSAALAMTGKFRMRPQSLNGLPVSGGKVRIPIRFAFPPLADGKDPPSATDGSLIQALRMMDAMGIVRQVVAGHETIAQRLEFTPSDTTTAEVRRLAGQAMRDAARAEQGTIRDLYARAYASVLSETELREAANFAEAPMGRVNAGRPRVSGNLETGGSRRGSVSPHLYARSLLRQLCV